MDGPRHLLIHGETEGIKTIGQSRTLSKGGEIEAKAITIPAKQGAGQGLLFTIQYRVIGHLEPAEGHQVPGFGHIARLPAGRVRDEFNLGFDPGIPEQHRIGGPIA